MDRKIEKKGIPLKRLIPITVICLVVIYLGFAVYSRSGKTRLKVPSDRMTISQVQYGEFHEYQPVNGEVVPVTTYYLEVEQGGGGRVEEIFAEEGKPIKEGDPILRFSNPQTVRTLLQYQAQQLDALNNAQNAQVTAAESKAQRDQSLLTMKSTLKALERRYKRQNILKKEKIVISEEEYQQTIDELELQRAQVKLQEESNKRQDILAERQLEKAEKAEEIAIKGLELLEEQMRSMVLTAPISGQLSSIRAKVGQNIVSGRIGWIDILDKLKINAGVDEYYLGDVKVGTKGHFTLDGKQYEVEVTKKFPEVDPASHEFRVDMAFVGDLPEGITRGQTLTTELSFGEPGQSLMVKKGGFYQQTSGRWVYIISEDGKTAHRQDMRLGRNNPRYVEVLEGLNEGDWIITSGYDTFHEADELIFNEPLKLEGEKNTKELTLGMAK